jgi:hypothetical protein
MRLHTSLTPLLMLALALSGAPAQQPTGDSPTPTLATQLPDISVIGNVLGAVSNDDENELDEHLRLQELELVLGSQIYPGIRGDAVIALHDPDFTAEVEEGYVTFEQFTSTLPVGGRFGIVRLPFGKTNPQHPHQLPTIDSPLVVTNLLGDEFLGNGFELVGLLPTRGSAFLQAQVGRWSPRAHEHEHEEDHDHDNHAERFDFTDTFTMGRLWAGVPLKNAGELEIGVSRAIGRNIHFDPQLDAGGNPVLDANGDPVMNRHAPDLRLQGYDLTWRHWLSGGRRILLQSEYISNTVITSSGLKRPSDGYYLLGAYRLNPFYEVGARYDWSESQRNIATTESAINAFVTRNLNETTFLRLQAVHGTNSAGETRKELWAQIVFGFGPHAHVLQ